MDANELEDRARQRWFIGFLSVCVILPIVLGVPAILLQYNQGELLSDIVKIVLGFLGAQGPELSSGDSVGNEGYSRAMQQNPQLSSNY